FKAELARLPGEEFVRDLDQNAGAVARAGVGTNGAAMLKVEEDGERILNDLVGPPPFDIGDEADAAGILVECGIVEPTHGCGGTRRCRTHLVRLLRRSMRPGDSRAALSSTHSTRPRVPCVPRLNALACVSASPGAPIVATVREPFSHRPPTICGP